MRSSVKRDISGPNGKEMALLELKKQKEKIMREMKEQEIRKQREKEAKNVKVNPIMVVATEKNVEKSPPVIKKISRMPPKSFAEIMKEAEMRTHKHISDKNVDSDQKVKSKITPSEMKSFSKNPIPDQKIKSKLTNSDNSGVKRHYSESVNNKSQNQSDNYSIPTKKPRLKENIEQSNLKTLNSINSTKRPVPINSLSNNSRKIVNTDNAREHMNKGKNNNFSTKSAPNMESNRLNPVNSLSHGTSKTKTGILAQSNAGGNYAQNRLMNNKNGICEQSSQRNNINSTSKPPVKVTSINDKQHSRPSLSNQNISKNQPLPQLGKSKNNVAVTNKPMQSSSRNNNPKPLGSNQYPSKQSGIYQQSANRGISAQNARVGTGYPTKSAYTNGHPSPPARGIAAQNIGASRGILAQSNRGQNGLNRYPSDSEDEVDEDCYDSDLGSFIDDSEYVVSEEIKSEIYKSLNHDPNKYGKVSRYDDCRNMESRFNDICKEEIRSSRIGREEDLQELRSEEKRLRKKGKL